MKRVRILLRVSSGQQLDADGDLSIQRNLVKDYVLQHNNWALDDKEYFEGSNSGYRHAAADRDVLQLALKDARNQEYDILAAYKDDRIGRRMWEIGAYVMALKGYGVDIYTVKDGCISPDNDDIMGQMMLALRYGNAQKSSSDTGMRVRDTAQKLVQQGKFMGGPPPYGYEAVLSGELSKHGRALHVLQIVPEKAAVVQYIYQLSLHQEYGSAKIAALLNQNPHCRTLAPHEIWKSGTVTGILTNPIYAGYMTYKRRERRNGSCHRLPCSDWIRADIPNEQLRIIDETQWMRVQEKRRLRAEQYGPDPARKKPHIISRNDGMLSLIDVIHCGYCGTKLINKTKYSYWTLKDTGQKRSSRTPLYHCPAVCPENHPCNRPVPCADNHPGDRPVPCADNRPGDRPVPCANNRPGSLCQNTVSFRADKLENAVHQALGRYLDRLLADFDIRTKIAEEREKLTRERERELVALEKEAQKLSCKIDVLQCHIPEAMAGCGPFTAKELSAALHRLQEKHLRQLHLIEEKKAVLDRTSGDHCGKEEPPAGLATWAQVFEKADGPIRRALVTKLIARIDVTKEQIRIQFRIPLTNTGPDSE